LQVMLGTTYFYRVKALDRAGHVEVFGPVFGRSEGDRFKAKEELGFAYPNPFGASFVRIPLALREEGQVKVRILDALGREVRLLFVGVMSSGEHVLTWDGRNAVGEMVPAGIYLYQLKSSSLSSTRRIVKLQKSR